MTDVIEKLTPEQEADLDVTRDTWIAIGLSCDPIDKKSAEEAVALMYKCAGLEPPKDYYHCDGPTAGAILSWELETGKDAKKTKPDISGQKNKACYGSQDASWVAYYDFFNRHFGLAPEIEGLVAVAKTCGWVWPYDKLAVISARPLEIHMDRNNTLHHESGPAVSYLDGTEIHSWHGVRVKKEWIENPQNIPAKEILTHENLEERRAGMEIIGWDKLLDMVDAKPIDEDPDPLIGTLFSVDLPDLSGRQRMVRYQCGTGRTFAQPVPPHINSVLEAKAFLADKPLQDYTPPELRT